MSRPLVWLQLTFPRDVTTTQAMAALLAMSGLSSPNRSDVIVLQAIGTRSGVQHQVGVSERLQAGVVRQLRTALPGLGIEVIEENVLPPVDRAWRGWQSTPARSLRLDDPEIVSGGLLTALSAVQGDEGARLALAPRSGAPAASSRCSSHRHA